MTAPDFMPVLKKGSHSNPRHGACVMEYVSILAGEPFSAVPKCTLRGLAEIAIEINDHLWDEERQQLLPLIPRLINTQIEDEETRDAVSNRLKLVRAVNKKKFTPALLEEALDIYDSFAGRARPSKMTDEEFVALERMRQKAAVS